MNKIQALREKVESELTDSNLTKATDEEISKLLSEYPCLPEDYLSLLKEIGYGSYGEMGFSIYGGPIDPEEIFDSETAKGLKEYVFIGDDYSGWMIGYKKTQNGYAFKEFDHQEVMELDPTNIIDFLAEELFRE